MGIAVVILTLLGAVTIHEAGHALVMRRLGIPVVEAGLGLPLPPTLLRFTAGGITWKLTPWLLGAYVSPGNKGAQRITALPFRDEASIDNAGIVVNLVAGFGFAAIGSGLSWKAGVWAALAAAVVIWRRVIAAYVLPALALPMLVFVTWSLARLWVQGQSGLGLAGLGEFTPHSFSAWLALVTDFNLSLAFLNMLPLFPLDNAKVCQTFITRWAGKRATTWYQMAGAAVVLLMMAGAVVSDVWTVVT